jgi:APA family basic amino acid/polyamine antiporter
VQLHRAIGRGGFFTLAFGATIGSAWIIVLGGWLGSAGPGGAIVGLLTGAIVTVMVATCYGELASRFTAAGGEILYTLETFGRLPGFLVGWFLTLYAVAVCAFEGIALAWFIRLLIPGIALGTVYTVRGAPVDGAALLIGLAGTILIAALHLRGARFAVRMQSLVTYGFILITATLILSGLLLGSPSNLKPVFASSNGRSWLIGAFWVFADCAYFLNGFQAALHAIEERRLDIDARTVVRYMLFAVVAAALFYCGVVLSAASAAPWQIMVGKELPAIAAYSSLFPGVFISKCILAAAAVSLFKSWSAMALVASRMVFAQSRSHLLPEWLSRTGDRSGAPFTAILFVSVGTAAGVLLGREAILPIVNMCSICLALSFVVCLLVLMRRRRTDAKIPAFVAPGGKWFVRAAFVGSIAMGAAAIANPFLEQRGRMPLEWIMIAAWGALGVAVAALSARRQP